MMKNFRHTRWMHSISRIILVVLVLLGSALASPLPLVHATDWCGTISSNTTWTLAGSPHIVTCNVTVESGVTLTIEPGVVVKFDGNYVLRIDGELIAQGTNGNLITFTSNAGTPAPGDWGHIFFTDTSVPASYDGLGNYQSGSIIQYGIIEYAGGASVINNGALRIDGSSPYIDHTTVRYGADNGIVVYFYSGAQKMTYNIITDNAGRGIAAHDIGLIEISHSTIHNNSNGGLFIDDVTDGAMVDHNTVTANSANDGGGIYISSITATISYNIVVSNSASSSGGGIYGQYAAVTAGNNVIAGNSADQGGGLYVNDAAGSTVSFNAILDNQASGNGGGIYATDVDNASITGNTILNNTAGVAQGGVYVSSHPVFNDNNIYDNSEYDLHNGNITGTTDLLNAQRNWWGTTDPIQIDDHILDDDEDAGLGQVDYSLYRSSHRTNAPISPPTGLTVTAVVTAINLAWSPNPESDLDGYKVYYDVDSGFPYLGTGADDGGSPIDVGNVTTFTLTGLPSGAQYYIAVTAYDDAASGADDQTEGHESWYSAEELADVPPQERFIYLPLVLRDFSVYFEGPWEIEPNDFYQQANGPLRSSRDYYGYPNDQKDFFSIDVRTGGDIVVDLSNHTGQGVQLQLFYQSVDVEGRVGLVYTPPYHIEYTGDPGWYYIYIYTESDHNDTDAYTLQATFP